MLNVNLKPVSNTLIDRRNKRLVVTGYTPGTAPAKLAAHLIDQAHKDHLGKIWVWALPADVPDFLRSGFRLEGHLFKGQDHEFTVSLAYYANPMRGESAEIQREDAILEAVSLAPGGYRMRMQNYQDTPAVAVSLLKPQHATQVSELLTKVFKTYPSPVEDPEYIRSLMLHDCLFAGAMHNGKLVSVAAAYMDKKLGRCEMTDCATLDKYQGHSLTEKLLNLLEAEVNKHGTFTFYTLARAQSAAMNRVFFKLGYQYRGRLINNCDIAGSFQNMNLWVR